VKAEFAVGDFAYDWVVNYLENHRVWNESRSFKVVARNAASRPYPTSNLGKVDGHPDPVYEPATTQSPSIFRWKGYWMSIVRMNRLLFFATSTDFEIDSELGWMESLRWGVQWRLQWDFGARVRVFATEYMLCC
jgi:hypothetical protein